MQVKIGDRTYSSADAPIMVILSAADKENIRNMHPDCTKYAEWDDASMTVEQAEEWMGKV